MTNPVLFGAGWVISTLHWLLSVFKYIYYTFRYPNQHGSESIQRLAFVGWPAQRSDTTTHNAPCSPPPERPENTDDTNEKESSTSRQPLKQLVTAPAKIISGLTRRLSLGGNNDNSASTSYQSRPPRFCPDLSRVDSIGSEDESESGKSQDYTESPTPTLKKSLSMSLHVPSVHMPQVPKVLRNRSFITPSTGAATAQGVWRDAVDLLHQHAPNIHAPNIHAPNISVPSVLKRSDNSFLPGSQMRKKTSHEELRPLPRRAISANISGDTPKRSATDPTPIPAKQTDPTASPPKTTRSISFASKPSLRRVNTDCTALDDQPAARSTPPPVDRTSSQSPPPMIRRVTSRSPTATTRQVINGPTSPKRRDAAQVPNTNLAVPSNPSAPPTLKQRIIYMEQDRPKPCMTGSSTINFRNPFSDASPPKISKSVDDYLADKAEEQRPRHNSAPESDVKTCKTFCKLFGIKQDGRRKSSVSERRRRSESDKDEVTVSLRSSMSSWFRGKHEASPRTRTQSTVDEVGCAEAIL